MSLLVLLLTAGIQTGAQPPDAAELLGVWRGTSTCTDRQAAPACKDEEAVYEFTPGPRRGLVHWIADKMVDGKRVNMGESELAYDTAERCWKVEMTSTPVKSVWRLSVTGGHLTGTARLLPGGQTVRKIDLRKQ